MLFRVCQEGSPAKWIVLLEGQPYGEYLNKKQAVTDAVEAATEARSLGHVAEVWDGSARVY